METNQNENDIKDEGATSEPLERSDVTGKTGKGGMILFFIVGFLIGVSLKAQAIKTITMGFNDYKISRYQSDFRPPVVKEEESQPSGESKQPAGQAGQDVTTSPDPQPETK